MSKVKESNFILTCKFRAYPSELLKHISFEDLNIKGPVKNHHLAKAILDAGWGTLITFAAYKAVMAGARVVKVSPTFTTQDCSVCGFRAPKTLAERIHRCPNCGAELDRDYNASINILMNGSNPYQELLRIWWSSSH